MGLCWTRFRDAWTTDALDYDDFNKGGWINVFGASSNRFLQNRTAWTAFRVLEAVLMTAIYAWSITDKAIDGEFACYFIYLTHWTLTLQALYFLFAAFTAWKAGQMESGAIPTSEAMPCYCRAMWIIQDLAIPGSFLVFLLYWALVYPERTSDPSALSYFTHGVNFVLQLLDMFLSRQPYYLLHGIYIAIFGTVYVAFSAIYYAAGGLDCNGNAYIYKALDWSQPQSTVTLMGIILFIGVPIINFTFWLMIAMCFPQNYKKPGTDAVAAPA
mmetsp:Transcript_63085/g.168496  ORF Transcript_63085/g.168496 Transcript_63085/m.168496 type:complete len:271 (-) Transcript_63085:130-942(-)